MCDLSCSCQTTCAKRAKIEQSEQEIISRACLAEGLNPRPLKPGERVIDGRIMYSDEWLDEWACHD